MSSTYKTKVSQAILRKIHNLPAEKDFNFSVYRFFQKEEHADALVNGHIWLSTIERCRAYEDAEQGDKWEASLNVGLSMISGGGNDHDFVSSAKSIGVRVEPEAEHMIITNSRSEYLVNDGYVLCATTHFSEEVRDKFGKYCVEIQNPFVFAELVSHHLSIDENITYSYHGKINYGERTFVDRNPPSTHIGFIKPPFPYAYQKEYRFLYIPDENKNLKPRIVYCPLLENICRKI